MQRIVKNSCWGGFGLSHEAILLYAEKKGIKLYFSPESGLGYRHYSTAPLVKNPNPKYGSGLDEFDWEDDTYYYPDYDRDDPILLEVIDELGDKADGHFAKLTVVEIPDGVDWQVDNYDGMESVHEVHRSW